MQVVDNSVGQFPHFFLLGFRVPVGQTYLEAHRVGVLVVKQTVSATGVVSNGNEVLLEDENYDPQSDPPQEPPPIRLESDLATTKPDLDIVIVRNEVDVPEFVPPPGPPPPPPIPFGEVRIDRLGGPPQIIPSVSYGWQPRIDSPRVERAGDAAALDTFPESGLDLPVDFENLFFNGSRSPVSVHLQTGDSVFLEEQDAASNPTGLTYNVTVPGSPDIVVKQTDELVIPQPTISLGVDTVVFDRVSEDFLLTWRAVFVWDDAHELAVLEIN